MRLIALSGLSTRTVRMAERFMLMEVTEYSSALGGKKKNKTKVKITNLKSQISNLQLK